MFFLKKSYLFLNLSNLNQPRTLPKSYLYYKINKIGLWGHCWVTRVEFKKVRF